METLLVALAFVSLFCLIIPSSAASFDKDDIVDLTWSIKDKKTMAYPLFQYQYERLDMVRALFNLSDTQIWVEYYGMKSPVHAGTHMDSGCHFNEHGQRSHEVTFDQLFGPAIVIDVKDKVKDNADYEMPLQEVHDWEKQHGTIPDRAIVLVNTGWGRFYGDVEAYTGYDGNSSVLTFPGVHHEAAEFLVDERNINVLGIDTPSPDSGISVSGGPNAWKVHLAILRKNRLIFENVAYLDLLPPTGYDIRTIPLKLYDTCGAPVRLIALKAAAARPLVELLMVLVVMVTGWMLKP